MVAEGVAGGRVVGVLVQADVRAEGEALLAAAEGCPVEAIGITPAGSGEAVHPPGE